MDRRSFIKRVGILAGLAILSPLKIFGLLKTEPVLSMETMKAAFDEVKTTEIFQG